MRKLSTIGKIYIDKTITCLVLLYFNLVYVALALAITLVIETIISLITDKK